MKSYSEPIIVIAIFNVFPGAQKLDRQFLISLPMFAM